MGSSISNPLRVSTTGTGRIEGQAQAQTTGNIDFVMQEFQRLLQPFNDIAREQAGFEQQLVRGALGERIGPTFGLLEQQAIGDLQGAGRDQQIQALTGRLRSGQASRGVFSSPFAAVPESLAIEQFVAQDKQRAFQQGLGFSSLALTDPLGNFSAAGIAPAFGDVFNIFNQERDTAKELFGFKRGLESQNAQTNAMLVATGVSSTLGVLG